MTGHTSADAALAAWRGVDQAAVTGMPTGDVVKQRLLHPALLRMLGDVEGRRVLDVGCGMGDLTRLLASRGARVTGLEPSPVLAGVTRTRAQESGAHLDVLEAPLIGAISGWGLEGAFDGVVASLALCVIPDLEPAVAACVEALRPGGLVVLAVEHPCFEQSCADWTRTGIAEVTRYLGEYELPGRIAPDFHRPLSTYLNAFIRAGCTLTEIAEPGLDADTAAEFPALRPLRELPLFLLVSARKADGGRARPSSSPAHTRP